MELVATAGARWVWSGCLTANVRQQINTQFPKAPLEINSSGFFCLE